MIAIYQRAVEEAEREVAKRFVAALERGGYALGLCQACHAPVVHPGEAAAYCEDCRPLPARHEGAYCGVEAPRCADPNADH